MSFVTEAENVGVRLSSANAANHGDIGITAVDLAIKAPGNYRRYGSTSLLLVLIQQHQRHSISGGYVSVASGDTSVALEMAHR